MNLTTERQRWYAAFWWDEVQMAWRLWRWTSKLLVKNLYGLLRCAVIR